jgi:hypothetical protein
MSCFVRAARGLDRRDSGLPHLDSPLSAEDNCAALPRPRRLPALRLEQPLVGPSPGSRCDP